ncbi:uncharacterized protein PGTG_10026 [Puccinia graminis f. sp. tritici CRL 75-36-700-3]|uniref:Uncharacterized protein n=1 Tax=Puccinia graminis f. sp. tritici (strain CRL 75-36-700-3 / race SCCL) TaxID=418459 RepID=E3KJ31_PUCGT|nr:uncharacterized protein PGTG_10026 [Puccinia graminis f. sp. tritici CRL 75-36-700-3]EFP84306.2 hypothetical protein PGTG_10026 [Puccinia graminis f. sp. tritici CRL 75-36-700-3]
MVSLAYLITLVAVLVAVSRADEVANAKTEQVDEKWIYPSYYRRGAAGPPETGNLGDFVAEVSPMRTQKLLYDSDPEYLPVRNQTIPAPEMMRL